VFHREIPQRFEYWNFGNYWGTGSDSIIDWTPFDPPAKPGYDIAFPGIGTYVIMMADRNQCGADTTFITIQITDQPNADFTMSTDSSCQGDVVNYTRLSTLATAHLINFGDGGGFQGFGATASHVYNTAGTFTVTVVANVGGGSPSCTDTTTLPIVILPSPSAIASINPNGGCDSVTSVFINTSSGGASYLWQFGGGDTSTLQNPPPISFTTSGQHVVTLTVTSNKGCANWLFL
jgi:PKD repeat protein